MTAMRNTARKGFTLVEILIVVIILGILAAIVIPQFTNASEDARKSNMKSQLQTLRSQLELYKLQHRDVPPPLVGFWDHMTRYTTDDVTVAPDDVKGTAAAPKFGPYLQAESINPLTNQSLVAAAAGPAVGWVYDEANGTIIGVSKGGEETETGEEPAAVTP